MKQSAFAKIQARARAALAPARGRVVIEGIDALEWFERALRRATRHTVPRAASERQQETRTQKNAARKPVEIAEYVRPIFIISPPRSGSTLLFETLALAPGVFTIGGESHLIEGIAGVHPADHGYESNRLVASDATPKVSAAVRLRLATQLRDRDGRSGFGRVRLLEKTPKNALRVPFLHAIFPDAQFVYLYRDPLKTMASMLDAWQADRFATYPHLPDWPGPPWSMLLTPGWRALAGRPLAEIVARQWATTVELALGDLAELPPQQWCVCDYDRFVAEPQAEVGRLCNFLGLEFDRTLSSPLPTSSSTLGLPNPHKWKRHAAALETVRSYFELAAKRAGEVMHLPQTRSSRRRVVGETAPPVPPKRRSRSFASGRKISP